MTRHVPRVCVVRLLLLILLSSALVRCAFAQTGIYAEFGGSKIDAPTDEWVYGPIFGIYSDFIPLPFVRLGLDLRGSILGVSQDTTLYSGLIGPRLAVHPKVVPFTPYVEAVFGIGNFDSGSVNGTDTKFEYQFLGGIDHTLLPRLDWRVVEFSYGGLSVLDSSLHPKTISTGLVLRLP
jgi:hypothetical protein